MYVWADQVLKNQSGESIRGINPLFVMEQPATETFHDLMAIVRRLRTDCPWDRQQTHASIAPLLIEEAWEVKESIQDGDDQGLKNELGDILLHVLMHGVIAQERGAFGFDDIVRAIAVKLVARHPHVYGDAVAADAADVKENWEKLKMKEGRTSLFQGMARGMPALQRADRVQEKAASVGFDWDQAEDVWKKVEEEVGELRQAVTGGQGPDRVEDELGDVLFAVVNYARFVGVKPEEALHRTVNKFISRFQYIEARLAEQNKTFDQTDLAEMDRYWNQAKETRD